MVWAARVGRSWRAIVGVSLASLVVACASTVPQTPSTAIQEPIGPPTGLATPYPMPTPVPDGRSPATLPGWDSEDHLAAFRAYVTGCGVARQQAARSVCERARSYAAETITPSDARAFFEASFSLVPAETADAKPGLLTSYFAPEYPARRSASAEFDAPVLARPADLVRSGDRFVQRRADGSTRPYPDRAAIEAGAADAPVLAWMRAEDLFFLQIQGSGYLTFEDGGQARAAYAADNGLKFTGIATPMARQALLPRNGTSGDAIRAWLARHRGPQARAITNLNPRYIFFALQDDDGGDPAGAAGVPLPARRAIAVDPSNWTYGDLVWIAADGGNLAGARASYQGLVMALDTGSAIRGPVRADLYMGRGDTAGEEAGAVRHPLRMWRLVPRT